MISEAKFYFVLPDDYTFTFISVILNCSIDAQFDVLIRTLSKPFFVFSILCML